MSNCEGLTVIPQEALALLCSCCTGFVALALHASSQNDIKMTGEGLRARWVVSAW